MTKQFIILFLVLIACSAPSEIQAEPVPKPVHGRALNEAEFISLVSAVTAGIDSTSLPVSTQPDVYARAIVNAADALAVEVRRSANWPKQ
jgi:hypothetical protein